MARKKDSEKEILELAAKFRARAKRSEVDDKRHDRIKPDEAMAMYRAKRELSWTVETIVSVFERDKRAVTPALKAGEQAESRAHLEELLKPAKEQAMLKHQEDLCQTVERWKSELSLSWSLRQPLIDWFSPITDDSTAKSTLAVERETLFDCLKEHLAGSPVWEQFGNWKELAAQHRRDCLDFATKIRQDAEKNTGLQIVRWGRRGVSDSFPEAVYTDAVDHALGYNGLEGLKYRIEQPNKARRWHELWIGGRGIAASHLVREMNACQRIHEDMLRCYRQYREPSDLVQQRQKMDKLTTNLGHQLDEILLRRMFLGRCRLCPE